MKKAIHLLTYIVATFAHHANAEVVSARLNDVIPSNGRGDINVFDVSGSAPDLTPVQLEAFRNDQGGLLAFAVDVNEAASGTEKSNSQGISLASVQLDVVINGQTQTFTQFYTQTQSLLAASGQTARASYFTLIGDSGSSRITSSTSSAINNSDFDAVLYVPVTANLSGASAVTLRIRLLNVNQQLGDPEQFYDFSNGYEDVALLSRQDAIYLDELKAGQQEAPLVIASGESDFAVSATQYYPSATSYYIAAYEDRYPLQGDYDFNDCVVAYRVSLQTNRYRRVVGLSATGYLVSRGASYPAEWWLKIAAQGATGQYTVQVYEPEQGALVPSESYTSAFNTQLNAKIFSNMKLLWSPQPSEYVNTEQAFAAERGHRFTLTATFDATLEQSQIAAAPFDPYLQVLATGFDIHLPGLQNNAADAVVANGYPTFTTSNGYPFALILPESWVPPAEEVNMGQSYPQLGQYIRSGRTAAINWYESPASNLLAPVTSVVWKW